MELSRLLGRPIVDRDGATVGRVADVAIRLVDPHPPITSIVTHRGSGVAIGWSAVSRVEEDRLELTTAGDPARRAVTDDELLLRRDVLDSPIFDTVGRRLSRVGDVTLVQDGSLLRVAGVDAGIAPVLRRLGLRRTGRRRSNPIDWTSVHLISSRGHALQLASDAVRTLSPHDIAEMLGRIPVSRGAELLAAAPTETAAAAVGHSRPLLGARMLAAVKPKRAAAIVSHMLRDDATAVLRHVAPEARDALLAEFESARADEMRRLLAHPPASAGGLMNPDVITARPGEPLTTVRARAALANPRLDALLTVFVVDDDNRPVGTFPPRVLIGGDPHAQPTPVPAIPASAAISAVIDLFALHDVLALPVVDDDGRLVGAVAVDDVLEELLIERLPGRRRFRGLRGRMR